MSRMRLMRDEGTGASALVCLYCGNEAESKPPYEVVRCDCRSVRPDREPGAAGAPLERAA